MPRFVILEHDHPELHWDLLLEHGMGCRTWRLAFSPDAAAEIPAEALPDHRLMYLDYEGPVRGGRGTVIQRDAGQFEWITATEDEIAVMLYGARCSGRLELIRTNDGWRARFVV
jgi:hypothetical protein